MHRPITSIRGVGPAKAAALAEIGIENIGDLLYRFPRRYIDRSLREGLPLIPGQDATVLVRVTSTYLAHGRRSRFMVQCKTTRDEGLTLVFFRSAGYFRKAFENDRTYIVSGRVEHFRGLQMAHPDFEQLDEEDSNLMHVGRIIPLYPSSEKLKKNSLDSRGFRRLVSAVLQDESLSIEEYLPEALLKQRELCGRRFALQQIHYPQDENALEQARARLKYEELFLFQNMMLHRRKQRMAIARHAVPKPLGKSPAYLRLLETLPFELTGDQKKAIGEMMQALAAPHPEAFLLQGDVGSGKTVTALAVALHYADAGFQTALMAPTEVLARQHFRTLTDLVGLNPAIQIDLLTGSDRKKAREQTIDRVANGQSALLVGTHSLIEESVRFRDLGLVIIDEQHRFGVEQREALRQKGDNPDLIVMTATPIPRTLSLTSFADLVLITLKEKPAGRKPIQTMWLPEERRPGLHKSIAKHVDAGRQCYIVYPVIEDSEKTDLRAAEDAFVELSKTIFPHYRVALLHGRLKGAERERIMQEFREGSVQILVTTTVIEVGVDVPNATIMVIEHAERFGISQLHQLRGRVGRGSEESFCVLMSVPDITPEAQQRLQAITESQDGFYLSEVDMKIRGPGELLGLRQHGLPGFRLADLAKDGALSQKAHEDVRKHPDLDEEALRMIRRQWVEGELVFPG